MHASSLENMQKCFDRYVWGTPLHQKPRLELVDLGGANVNGSYNSVFSGGRFNYRGADLQAGPGVDIVLEDPTIIPLDDASVDILISGQMLEHCERFWMVFQEMVRVLRDDGILFLIAPSAGPIHRYPVDCYRFYPDAYQALADYAGCQLVDCWMDDRGPWNDLVGVFSKQTRDKVERSARPFAPAANVNGFAGTHADPAVERMAGAGDYLDVLAALHRDLLPDAYLEIGVRRGRSLSLAACPAVGVDPEPAPGCEMPDTARLVRQTSDAFFDAGDDPILQAKPDLVFIDGMHLFEYVLRDFMHTERVSHAGTVVVIDDVLPNHVLQARRERESRVWTGDVWKIMPVLRSHRPDLKLTVFDTHPTGLLVVSGLDPKNRVLWQKYNPIVRHALHDMGEPGEDVLNRSGVLDPSALSRELIMPS